MKGISFIGLVGAGAGWWTGLLTRSDAEKVLMAAVFVVVVLDWLTGISASYKEGKPISSERSRKGLPKLVGYICLVVLVFVTPEVLKAVKAPVPELPIPTAALGYIFATEAWSVIENIMRTTDLKLGWLARIIRGANVIPEEQAKEEQP